MKPSIIISVVMCILVLAGCHHSMITTATPSVSSRAEASTIETTVQETASASVSLPIEKELLAGGYMILADDAARKGLTDVSNELAYRGLQLSENQDVALLEDEALDSRDPDLALARELYYANKEAYPSLEHAILAQLMYDCWSMEVASGQQFVDSIACKQAFFESLREWNQFCSNERGYPRIANIYFSKNSTQLHEEYSPVLAKMVEGLRSLPRARITINSFVGEDEFDGAILSQKRTDIIREHLVSQGASADKILVNYKGSVDDATLPALDDTRKRMYKRRIEMTLTQP